MSCPNPVELSRALVIGIDDRLRAHLDICTQCSEELDAHAAVVGHTRRLPIVEPSAEHARDLRVELMAAARTPVPAARSRFIGGFATAGALAAAAVLAFVLLKPTQPAPAPVARGMIMPHEGAEVMRVGTGPDEIVRVAQGTVSVKVAKLERGERFRVVTGDAELEGTDDAAFDVSVERDHLSSVRVIAGQVILRAQGAPEKLLRVGERWEVELVSNEPAPVIDDAPVTASEVTAPSETTYTPPTSKKRMKHKAPAKALSAKPTPAPAAPARAKRPIELLFDEGWATLQAGDAPGAAAIFERAAQSAPNDPLAEDAWFWRASALARAKSAAAAGALDTFLAHYPKSPRAGEASAMLGWLVMDSDLDRADKLFKAAANDRVAAVRASASKGLAAVEQRRKR